MISYVLQKDTSSTLYQNLLRVNSINQSSTQKHSQLVVGLIYNQNYFCNSNNNNRRFLQTQINTSTNINLGSTATNAKKNTHQWNFFANGTTTNVRDVRPMSIEDIRFSNTSNSNSPIFKTQEKVGGGSLKWSSYKMPSKDILKDHLKNYKLQEIRLRTTKEKEVQTSTPILATSAPFDSSNVTNESASTINVTTNANTTTSPTKKKRNRTLKPRKALISLSPKAISHLKTLLDQPTPKLIRIGTRNRGCSGLTYDLKYIDKPDKFDEVIEQNGIKIVIDSKALFSVVGSEMDWIDDKLQSRFVFKNPNSKGTCGCGESFMI
ncbi:hypothetical protein TBLA_0E01520 [Henningerozyma blattae CBS 6284]|uniref:Iron-sulfur assembly protein 1 n=1 Tax=Henningerozyma blattae (strain ATCC 34711 / CBS 6284 / DSM 70876 / NBRC 10599 / NRRL Y-10934 / UCD 77-7) TaxID=1071380 RepID=I2H4A7_HENB6|nr:hypothetical protein TBLA_0E01520 [Tetrapisispora blattae CBS 6284]CCH61209.1 hypothetical protein TBLA_0E01520 [Tetrapisispora blattae CBS 6284]